MAKQNFIPVESEAQQEYRKAVRSGLEVLAQAQDGMLTLKQSAQYLNVTTEQIRAIIRGNKVESTLVPVAEESDVERHMLSLESLQAYNSVKGRRQNGLRDRLIKLTDEQVAIVNQFLTQQNIDTEIRERYPRK